MCFVTAWLLSRPAPASLCIAPVSEAHFCLSYRSNNSTIPIFFCQTRIEIDERIG
jgi:hypothetical protein